MLSNIVELRWECESFDKNKGKKKLAIWYTGDN